MTVTMAFIQEPHGTENSTSFLKKRSKKLFLLWARGVCIATAHTPA
jgi:hypothetical protein